MDISKVEIKRSDFPKDFVFGAGTSAYQVEGAWNVDGKGRSTWDNFSIHTPGSIADGSNGRTATDHYNMFKDDIALMKKVGLDAYRFSIAWSRILPAGKLSGGVSKEGIKYYNDLIDALLAEGIEPWATLFHWDLPQCLEDEYDGFLDIKIVSDFCDYADVCFWEFGDRVKHWTTLNEPWSYTYMGYVTGFFPPGRGGFFAPIVKQAKEEAKRKRELDDATKNSTYSYSERDLDWMSVFAEIMRDILMDPEKILTRLPVRSQELTHRSPIGTCLAYDPFIDSEEDSDTDGEDSGTNGEDSGTNGEDSGTNGEDSGTNGEDSDTDGEDADTDEEEDSDTDGEDADTDEEEDSDTDEEEDSDTEEILDAWACNLVGYTLFQRDLEKKQSGGRSSLQRYLGLDEHAATQKDQPTTGAARTKQPATATEQTKQAVTTAEQKSSQETLMKRKAIPLKGDPGTEPYTAAHNLILAHAHAVKMYRTDYQKHQGGEIGITNVAVWFYPYNTDKQEDVEAASRAIDFILGWFVAPIVTGDYPTSMRNIVKQRLPKFTPEEVTLIKGSYDFIGINYYTTYYAKHEPRIACSIAHHDIDVHVEHKFVRNNEPIGEKGGCRWFYVVPEGIYHLMVYMKERYNNPVTYITENGFCEENIKTNTISKVCNDEMRTKYHRDHLAYLKKAMDDGVRLKGYFIWSLLDNFEWHDGYKVRFGIFYVNFVNGRLTRFPKNSAKWWMKFLNKPMLSWNALPYNPEALKSLLTEKTEEDLQDSLKKERVKN